MLTPPFPTDAEILAVRPAKNVVDPWRPYAMLVEDECAASGDVEAVATIFITNRECPFRCLMCDLWKNTTDSATPAGAVPAQIDYALERLPPARHIKLYNSGNFFDRLAVPPADYPAIAARLRSFRTVIVESHPRLCGDECLRFRDLLGPDQELEIAMGLETIHPEVLPRLNKHMTCDDFARTARWLTSEGVALRTFILLRPPLLDEADGIEWALRSLAFAFDAGVRVAAVIPTRPGNGLLDRWREAGWFAPPKLTSLETVLDRGVEWRRGRVLADLWDVERFSDCDACFVARRNRLDRINRTQQPEPSLSCPACGGSGRIRDE